MPKIFCEPSDPLPHFYVINLERSKERWAKFAAFSAYSEERFTRIDAVDGHNIAEADYKDFDIRAFTLKNGRHPRPGEYGCYRSHIKAIETFANSPYETAVIFEDDAELSEEGIRFCATLDEKHMGNACIIRLTTHRKALYEPLDKAHNRFTIGQSWFGPTGSAAAYWLNKAAAQKLLDAISLGSLPFDIALESAWSHHVPSLITKPNVFPRPRPPSSDINYDANPKFKKHPIYKRLPVLIFRVAEIFRRAWHSLKTRSLPS